MAALMDADIQAVVQFMQTHVPAARLVSVAAGLHALAPVMWGQYPCEAIKPLTVSPDDPRTQSNASGCFLGAEYAGDGSAEAGGALP